MTNGTQCAAEIASLEVLDRLCTIAKRDTGQCRRVADFLLSWHTPRTTADEAPTDLWAVDEKPCSA